MYNYIHKTFLFLGWKKRSCVYFISVLIKGRVQAVKASAVVERLH